MAEKRVVKEFTPLKDEFLENPFSILDTKTKQWQDRKNEWLSLGLNNEIGRENIKKYKGIERNRIIGLESTPESYVSTFDPYLCEVMYKWFCKENGRILDPFCGGVTRGVVANKLGYDYTGIDIREEQIMSNINVSNDILGNQSPTYICGDSETVIDNIKGKFDMVFTCPPYFNLEIYSDKEKDISNMDWGSFKESYYNIIKKSSEKLRKGGYAVFVVGEVRDRSGFLYGLIPYTIKCFMNCGMIYYNELILASHIASAAVRARQCMKSQKVPKIHQNILVFKKHRVNNVEKERL